MKPLRQRNWFGSHIKPVQSAIKNMAITACALWILQPLQAQAPGDLRVALVIGNGAYPGNAALPNPSNDAQAMSETLRGLGFNVVEARDASRAQMSEAIAKVRDSLRGKQGVGMLYYAGHGLQLDWRNYMLPVDAKLTKASDVPEQSIDVAQVIDAFKTAGNRMNIVVLDACRDNPFASTASGKGLAQLDAPPGTFLAYATAPGNVAEDGTGQNGLYTSFLLQELKKPQAKIEDVFKRVRLQVRQKSEGRQIPWESTSLEDDFFFNSGVKATAALNSSERERAFNEEKAEWDKIKGSKSVSDFYAFLQKYPNGNINALAQSKVEQFQKSQTIAVVNKEGRKTGGVFDVYKPGDEYDFQVKDGLTGVVRGTAKITSVPRGEDMIEGVSSDPSLVQGAILTRGGFLARDGAGSYDPPISFFPNGELKIGGKATTRTIRTENSGFKGWVEIESRVVGFEDIDTAFGKMRTVKLEATYVFQNGTRRKMSLWFDPDWGYSVKLVSETRSRTGAPDIYVREMISRKRVS
jgi:uncharacterized caspase-like protein